MAIRVLGPLETGESTLSPREQAILSILIVRNGEPVSPDEIADAYWGENPPRTWSQQVKTSVARIRERLGHDAVQTRGSRYALGIDPITIDASEFERLVAQARNHVLNHDDERAIDAYERAVRLWRGTAFPDLADWEPARAEAARLAELRRSVEEELLEERLLLGRHREIIADAERAVRAEPLREERWAILATANYRSGRQAEALATIRAARVRLVDEVGIEPSARLRDLESAMLRQDPALDAVEPTASESDDRCPYRGLTAFGPDDAEAFFGREDEADAILSRLRPGAVVAVIGASGSGKSSLVLAGLVPRQREAGRRCAVVRAGAGVVDALRTALRDEGAPEVLVVDQTEGVFQLADDDVEQAAVLIDSALERGSAVVLTLRSDFVDRAIALPHIGRGVARGLYALGPLTEAGLRQAIAEPAARAGLRLEPGLVELIVRDAGDRRTTLPHVSHALMETWVRREGRVLTVDGYEASGGIAGAIAQSAESAYQAMDAAEAAACRSLMLRLMQRDADGRSVRRPAQLEPLLADAARRRVLERLIAARLLTSDGDSVVIAHEAIATAWPRLDGWLDEDAEGARLVAAVSAGADLWQASGRRDEDLLRGVRLQAAADWLASSEPDLTAVEREFVDASADRERDEFRALAERAERDKRSNRRLRVAVAGAGVLLVAAVVGGVFAGVQGREAQVAAENARIEALTATSLSLRDNDRETSALLAAEAYRRWPDDVRTRAALWGVISGAGGLASTRHAEASVHLPVLDVIPGTDTAVRVQSSAPGGTPRVDVVDIDTGEVVRAYGTVLPEPGAIGWSDVIVSPDGSMAAIQSPMADPTGGAACCTKMLTIVDLESGTALPGTGTVRAGMSGPMVFDMDTRTLFVSRPPDGELMAVDLETGAVRESSPGAFDRPMEWTDESYAVVLIPGGLAAVGAGDRILVYDRESLVRTRTILLGMEAANHDTVADGQGGVVSTGFDGTVRVDLETGQVLWRRNVDGEGQCGNLHPATDDAIACGSFLGATLLDLATGDATNAGATLQLNRVPYFSTLDDGSLLVSIETPPVWMRWRVDGGAAGSTVIAKGRELIGGPEEGGSLVVTRAYPGGPMRLWDIERDVAVGRESDRIVLVGSGIAARFENGGPPVLEGTTGGEPRPLELAGVPEVVDVLPGGWGRPAFATWDGGVMAFDPITGTSLGAALAVPDEPFAIQSVSETRDGERAVVTWVDGAENFETGVFDLATGELLVRGLLDLESSRVIDDDEFVGISASDAHRYDISTLAATSALPRAVGGGQAVTASEDGRVLLNVGWNNALSLYDLDAGTSLAAPLRSRLTSYEMVGGMPAGFLVGGFLTSDGETLLERIDGGIRVWDLRPAAQAASACGLAGRELSEQEWATYFPGEQRVATCAALAADGTGAAQDAESPARP